MEKLHREKNYLRACKSCGDRVRTIYIFHCNKAKCRKAAKDRRRRKEREFDQSKRFAERASIVCGFCGKGLDPSRPSTSKYCKGGKCRSKARHKRNKTIQAPSLADLSAPFYNNITVPLGYDPIAKKTVSGVTVKTNSHS